MKMKIVALGAALALALTPGIARAQTLSPATQALSACVVSHVTPEDSVTTMTWMFMAMSRHPNVSSTASISDAQRAETDRRMGELFNRLLLTDCEAEARTAHEADGLEGIYTAFGSLGEHAMTEITTNPDVNAAIGGFGAYIDVARLEALIGARAK
jgi:hypothetical protein